MSLLLPRNHHPSGVLPDTTMITHHEAYHFSLAASLRSFFFPYSIPYIFSQRQKRVECARAVTYPDYVLRPALKIPNYYLDPFVSKRLSSCTRNLDESLGKPGRPRVVKLGMAANQQPHTPKLSFT